MVLRPSSASWWLKFLVVSLVHIALIAVAAVGAENTPPARKNIGRNRTTGNMPQATTKKVPGLPFDRVIRPGLERQLAKMKHSLQKRRPRATASRPSALLPNFGGFLAAPKYEAFDVVDQDNSPLSVFTSGDFNGDGKPDIATVQASGTVNAILNQGNGIFGSPVSTLITTNYVGGAIQALAIDVNKDGKDDLILLDSLNNTVDELLSNGDGSFGEPQLFTASSNSVASMATADVNGDGYPDLIVVSETFSFGSTISTTIELDTLLNNTNGGFLAPSGSLRRILHLNDEYDTLWGRSIAVADVTGDGVLDATVETRHWLSNPTPTEDSEHVIMTFHGTSGGAFAAPDIANNVVIPSESTFNIGYPLVANLNLVDLNHDGILDIVFSYQDYYIWAALGNGDGTYQFYYNVGVSQAYPTDLMAADINGDGFPELIDAEPGYTGVYTNRGDGTFDTSSIPWYGSSIGQFSVLTIADFTGDGRPDAAIMNSVDGSITMFAGVTGAAASFSGAELINPQMGGVSGVVGQVVLDTNGDGNDDVVLYNEHVSVDYPGLVTALGDGKGNFVYKSALPGYQQSIYDFIDQGAGDFNGDGRNDIVLHTTSAVSLLLSNGDGTFTSKPISLPSFSCITGKSAIGDLNGDGKLDLVIAYGGDLANPGCNAGTTASGVFVLLGNGDGTFQTPQFVAVGDEVYEPVLADTRNSGKLDLIVSDVPFDLLAQGIPASFNTFLLLGNGDGTFQAPTTLLTDNINAHTMAGDVNGDGKTDLVVLTEGTTDEFGNYNPSAAGVLTLLGNGDGTFAEEPLFLPGFFSAGGVLTDFNGDGKLDLAVSEYSSYDFTDTVTGGVAALGNGDGTFTAASKFEGGDSSSIILEGDFLKDGAPDTVYVSGLSGSSLLLNQGGTTVLLTADQSSINAGDTVNIGATVKATMGGRPQPGGTVTLMEGPTNLGSGTLSGGSTSISVANLAVGPHTITAIYSGDTNFNVNANSSIIVQVQPTPAVTVTPSATSLSLTQGATGTITFSAAANASFTGSVSFAVSGAPAGMSVSFTPSEVSLTPSTTATAVLVVSTTSPKSEMQWPLGAGGGMSLAGIVLLFIPRRQRRKMATFAIVVLSTAVLAATLGLTGCGSNTGSNVNTAPKGTATLTVSATPQGLSAQTVSVTITVQ